MHFLIYDECGLFLLCRLTLPDEAEAHSEDGVWEADWDSDKEANKDAGIFQCHNFTSQKICVAFVDYMHTSPECK